MIRFLTPATRSRSHEPPGEAMSSKCGEQYTASGPGRSRDYSLERPGPRTGPHAPDPCGPTHRTPDPTHRTPRTDAAVNIFETARNRWENREISRSDDCTMNSFGA